MKIINNGLRYNASVKVMRSYDYCHFEVSLGTELPLTLEEIDEIRKEAAKLADRAVEQYKIAKRFAAEAEQDSRQASWLKHQVEQILKKPESEWDEDEKANVKALRDIEFRASRASYDYSDEFEG